MSRVLFFFFQAEDGIRDVAVTGVQTCALPICYATANEAVQDVESKYVGRLSVKDSMQIQLAKRQLKMFNQQLKDSMMMQGLTKDYNEIMSRVEESRLEHEKQLRIARIRRRENIKLLKTIGVVLTSAVISFGVILSLLMFIFKK